MTDKKVLLKTSELSAGYRDRVVVSGVDFELREGEIITLIGPNGEGKSTILKTLAGYLGKLAGTIYLSGREFSAMPQPERAKHLSVMLTGRTDAELMKVKDVAAMGRYPYTGRFGSLKERDIQKVDEAMTLTEVSDLSERLFNEISDGQRQRVLLSRAFAQEPEVLILDEPTSFLDIRHKLKLLTILKKRAGEGGLAIVMSLHETDLAQKISDRILCVKDGRIVRSGTPEEIFAGSYIEELYGIREGSCPEFFASPELERPAGDPEVFVIAGGGSGIPVYRSLARAGTPFATGILTKNDLDFPVAKVLSDRVIFEEAYGRITRESVEEAKKLIDSCRSVLCPLRTFGEMNEGNLKLLEYARQQGKADEKIQP